MAGEITLNKVVRKRKFYGLTPCLDCGEEVEKWGPTRRRCAKCAAERITHYPEQKFKKYFPVYRASERWWLETLFTEDYREKRANHKEKFARERLARLGEELRGPSPCKGCELYDHCADRKLMCEAAYKWGDKSGEATVWGKRGNPNRTYYALSFPRDTTIKENV